MIKWENKNWSKKIQWAVASFFLLFDGIFYYKFTIQEHEQIEQTIVIKSPIIRRWQ